MSGNPRYAYSRCLGARFHRVPACFIFEDHNFAGEMAWETGPIFAGVRRRLPPKVAREWTSVASQLLLATVTGGTLILFSVRSG